MRRDVEKRDSNKDWLIEWEGKMNRAREKELKNICRCSVKIQEI